MRLFLVLTLLALSALLAALTPTPDQRILKSGCRIEDRRLASRKIAEHHNILNCI